jgi:thiol-disulfide isomerase/thioredoxin
MSRRGFVVAALSIAAALGYGYHVVRQLQSAAMPEIAPMAVKRLYATTLPDTAGKLYRFSDWQGKVLVVNFWATWCPPCRAEMPAFSRVQEKLAVAGVQFVGIGIDSPAAIRDFAQEFPMSYPLVIGGADGVALYQGLGNQNGALPQTVIFARDGEPVFARLGMVSERELEDVLVPLAGKY